VNDNRKELLTITMTREKWDAAVRRGWSYSDQWKVDQEFREKVDEGYEDRREAARLEFEAALPKLTDAVRQAVEEETIRLVQARRDGSLEVDHLGNPASVIGGFAVSVTPNISGGGSALHFCRDGSWWFDRNEYPLPIEDRDWFIDMAHRVTGENGEAWNLAPASTPWISVKFNPHNRPKGSK
jgi:hypothetical protein